MEPNKHSTVSNLAGQEGCDWAVLIPRSLWNMKGRPSGWQWISKVKLKGNLVSMETPGKVVWAMFSGAFSVATERCGGQD